MAARYRGNGNLCRTRASVFNLNTKPLRTAAFHPHQTSLKRPIADVAKQQQLRLSSRKLPKRAIYMILSSFDGPVWRLLPSVLVETPNAAASAPEGRFHHSGQVAVYASLSAEGAKVAMQRYLSDGVRRSLMPMWLDAKVVADIRGDSIASIVWQDLRENGEVSPTWKFSDAARRAGAQAMLYSSRSRPDISHVVVFQTDCLRLVGPVSDFSR